ncbi:MAG: hypothetical protein ACI9N9_002166 [Enterobacterales bacterium]|jgi:hypothetical protein
MLSFTQCPPCSYCLSRIDFVKTLFHSTSSEAFTDNTILYRTVLLTTYSLFKALVTAIFLFLILVYQHI